MSKQIKTEIFLSPCDGEPVEVIYSGFKMGSILDSEIDVDIHSIDGKPFKQCSISEIQNISEQILFHELQYRASNSDFKAEAKGDELCRHN